MKGVSRNFQGCFKANKECFEEYLRVFEGSSKGISIMLNECFKKVAGCFESGLRISRKALFCFKQSP